MDFLMDPSQFDRWSCQ